jgi:hypothetical protein
MQTSFMHPPFGFALFYLRSVAPKEVKTTDIYWGAVPFVLIQVIMVAMIILFPSVVSIGKKTDMKEKLQLQIETPMLNQGYGSSPQLNFSNDGSKNDSGDLQLNFSSDADKK